MDTPHVADTPVDPPVAAASVPASPVAATPVAASPMAAAFRLMLPMLMLLQLSHGFHYCAAPPVAAAQAAASL